MTNEKQYSERIAALIKQFLDEDEWKYTFYEEDGVFTFGELIDGAIKTIHYRVFVRLDDYIVNASVEIGADPKDAKLMANMAEFICRANDGLTGGKFEFDFEDGSIMAMSFTNCENIEPSEEMIGYSIFILSHMFERYGKGIINVLSGKVTPKDAIEECETEEEES
ncbi:MAG: hypothetical protein SO020_03750 [Lachnospiraceae bacterium]|nr:hypothetical protein [Lachnospiraceae bacterium]